MTEIVPRVPLPVRAVLTLAALFVAAFSGYLAMVLPAGTGRTVVSHLCATVIGLGLAIALVRGVDRRPVAALGLGRPAPGASLAALAAIGACTAAATGLAAALGLTTPAPEVPDVPMWTLLAGVLTMLTRAFLLQGFPEEVLFRGYLVQSALGRLPLWGVTALSVLVFGLPHLLSGSGAQSFGQQVLFLLLPIGFALLATAFRLRSGSVWPAVAVHGGFHVSWWAAGLFVTPRPEAYGAFLAVAGAVFLVVGLAAAVWAVRRTRAASPGSVRPGFGGFARP
ncbi:CPBP family intramembrane glutamic endopeptidase [Catenuloplanes atrovinosus]|uniref:Membrane protease YdiL (CAAX protease family) n=1 Tax=Catenuloplanes atrovinosus TaxID=137266 RepID=A0AAE4C9N3_9ACTN|nr:CPBP family intramembrane glutamic endopeptidase [Catenuloplanes atrovinosus]MDR7276731.1 membrane protease YdiL (CAAX protease family) [Catenuloplanes atrovinosus]